MASEALGHIRSPIGLTYTISLRRDFYGCTSDRIVEATLPRLSLAEVGWAAAHLGGQLILPLAQVDDMSEETVRCPFDVAHFNDHLGPDPMHPREQQRRTEPIASWWRCRERHLVDLQRLKSPPQTLQLGDR